MRQLIVIVFTVFLAEIGDKTQLATMIFATDRSTGKLGIFIAASTALAASTLLAVVAGEFITRFIPASTLKLPAGVGFIAVGLWTLVSASR